MKILLEPRSLLVLQGSAKFGLQKDDSLKASNDHRIPFPVVDSGIFTCFPSS